MQSVHEDAWMDQDLLLEDLCLLDDISLWQDLVARVSKKTRKVTDTGFVLAMILAAAMFRIQSTR